MTQATDKIVTANRLVDGAVVYLTARGGWSESITDGRIALGEFESRDLMAWAHRSADRNEVVGPYLMAIEAAGAQGGERAVGMRETIRAGGPTVETGR
jgi:hypothetical protein